MIRFVIEFVAYSGLLLLATIPVSRVARQRRRLKTPRRWQIAAGTCGFVLAILAVTSRDLVGKCDNAGYNNCFDVGSSGIRVLVISGFVVWALLSAYLLHNDY